jgi:hypothetical protein
MYLFRTAIISLLLSGLTFAQNYTTITATQIPNSVGGLLQTGTLCFQPTDGNANSISITPGGTVSPTRGPFCAAVSGGTVAALSVPTPAAAMPSSMTYTVIVQHGANIVRFWTLVPVAGSTFSFDQWMAANTGTGPNSFGTNGTAYGQGSLFRGLYTSAPNAVQNFNPLGCYADDETGGVNNTGGPKTGYQCLGVTLVSRTQGTHYGVGGVQSCLGEGDCVGTVAYVYGFGGSNAGGDEGIEALHLEADQGNGPNATASSNIATATVSSATSSGGTTALTLGSGVNLNLLGELRWLIDTNASKIYSTGTVSGIVGAPPVVTGSGTSWASLTGGQYCFSLNSNANGALMQVIPIAAITDNTHLTLGYNVQGHANTFAGLYSTGNYQIFPCSQVAAGGLPSGLGGTSGTPVTSATVTVTNGYTGWSGGDTLQLPLGFDAIVGGGYINIGPLIPLGVIPHGLVIENLTGVLLQPETWGLIVGNGGGGFSRGIEVNPGSNQFTALSCEDGSVTQSFCSFKWQEHANTYDGWSWNSGGNIGLIGFDRTTGEFTVSDSVNGVLLKADNLTTGPVLGTGSTKLSLAPNLTTSNLTLIQGPYGTAAAWGSGASITSIKNNSKDEGGSLNLTVGTAPGTYPAVKLTFANPNFNSVACIATMIDQTGAAVALPNYGEPTYVEFIWPATGVPPISTGSTPPAGETIRVTWVCTGLS